MLDPSHPSNSAPAYLNPTQPPTDALASDAAKSRRIGYLCIPLGLAVCWFFIWRPLADAQQTGSLHYYIKGILLGPVMLYTGVLSFITDIRDGEIRTFNEKGKKTLTRKGWYFMIGLFVVMGATVAGWYVLLNSLGFHDL